MLSSENKKWRGLWFLLTKCCDVNSGIAEKWQKSVWELTNRGAHQSNRKQLQTAVLTPFDQVRQCSLSLFWPLQIEKRI